MRIRASTAASTALMVVVMIGSAQPSVGQSPATEPVGSPASSPTPHALTWTRVPGMAEAFEGSELSLVRRGGDGFLALGRSVTSGLPRAWLSNDGLSWRHVPLPPTTFGGGVPQEVVWGPSGWVALGWNVTLERGVRQQVWLSPDGMTWAPADHPSGLLRTRQASDIAPADPWRLPSRTLLRVGDDLFITESEGSLPLRVSQDGERWREAARLPSTQAQAPSGTDPSDGEMVPGPRGYLFDDWPDRVWASADGLTWIQAPYPGDGERLMFLGWDGGWIAHAQERIGDGIWYSADGSQWTAGAVTDPNLAQEPELRAVGLDGSRLLVIQGLGYPGIVSDAWLGTFGPPAERPQATVSGQAPIDPPVDPTIVPLVRPSGLDCPEKPRTLRRLLGIAAWKAAICFGDQPIRVVGAAFRTTEAPGSSGTAFDDALFVKGSSWGIAPILAQSSRVARQNGARDYVVTGHFADASCRTDPSGHPTPGAALLACQQTFVPTSIRRARR